MTFNCGPDCQELCEDAWEECSDTEGHINKKEETIDSCVTKCEKDDSDDDEVDLEYPSIIL